MDLRSVFGGVSANALALDLGADSVKVLALQRKGSIIRIVGAGIAKMPPFAVVDGQIMDQSSLRPAILSALTMAGLSSFRGLPTVVGLRGVRVVCALVQLPALGTEEMADQILLEAQQHIDSDLAEWRIDYDIVTKVDERGQVIVALVGARNSLLDSYVEVLKSLELSLDVVDLDVFALANVVEKTRGGELSGNVLCLDIGRDATRIYLMSEGVPQIIRSASLGGQHLTIMISEMNGLPVDEAEKAKVSAMASPEKEVSPEIQKSVDAFIDDLCLEIKNTIEFFTKNSGGEFAVKLEQIFISGGCANVRGLTQKIATVFESPVSVLNPFARVDIIPEVLESLGAEAHLYGVAVGLALRKKNDKNTVEKKNTTPALGNFKKLEIPKSYQKIIGLVAGGAVLVALAAFGADLYFNQKPPEPVAAPAPVDASAIPKMTPEQYAKLFERLKKDSETAKAEGKPFAQQKKLDKLIEMKNKGEF